MATRQVRAIFASRVILIVSSYLHKTGRVCECCGARGLSGPIGDVPFAHGKMMIKWTKRFWIITHRPNENTVTSSFYRCQEFGTSGSNRASHRPRRNHTTLRGGVSLPREHTIGWCRLRKALPGPDHCQLSDEKLRNAKSNFRVADITYSIRPHHLKMLVFIEDL